MPLQSYGSRYHFRQAIRLCHPSWPSPPMFFTLCSRHSQHTLTQLPPRTRTPSAQPTRNDYHLVVSAFVMAFHTGLAVHDGL